MTTEAKFSQSDFFSEHTTGKKLYHDIQRHLKFKRRDVDADTVSIASQSHRDSWWDALNYNIRTTEGTPSNEMATR